jgi:hypothetical protein
VIFSIHYASRDFLAKFVVYFQKFLRELLRKKTMVTRNKQKALIRDLGDGLILRRSTVADSDALDDFNSRLHSDEGWDKPDDRVGAWARDLLRGDHPTFGEGDYTIVEDTKKGKIVSSLNLISQTWTYDGIPFKVGRPELVGTLPEYRKRGLVRQQFEVVHQWSAERGELLQGITGIPYYYRLFGYEMTVDLDGGRGGYSLQVPQLKEGEQEPFIIRTATREDLPEIAEAYRYGCQRSLLSCIWDEDILEYEVLLKSPRNINRNEFRMIENVDGKSVGYLAHPGWTWGKMLPALHFELLPGVSWSAVAPSVVRYLFQTGIGMAAENKIEGFDAFGFWLGGEHPVYTVLKDRLPRVRKPYAWYIRVPDLPAFLIHITPVLNERLDKSLYVGHSGEVKITFYRDGIRMVFEKGRLIQVERWRPEPQGHSGDAGFPNLTFLQLVFGHRSRDELNYAFPDCWCSNDEVNGLLGVLFPKKSSHIIPVS